MLGFVGKQFQVAQDGGASQHVNASPFFIFRTRAVGSSFAYRESVQHGGGVAIDCLHHVVGIIRVVGLNADVSTENGRISGPVPVVVSIDAGIATQYDDPVFQIERKGAVSVGGRLVSARGHPDLVTGIGHRQSILQLAVGIGPGRSIVKSGSACLHEDGFG